MIGILRGTQCRWLNESIFFDNDWLRFKVVRNPFTRVVSSYLENIKSHYIKTLNENSTFYNYIEFLEKKKILRYIEGMHSDWQHRDFEKNCKNVTFYQIIVKVEEPTESLAKINFSKGVNFIMNFTSSHWHTHNDNNNTDNDDIFLGNLTYKNIIKKTSVLTVNILSFFL